MANFKGIVYLTNEQYTTLQTNGTITVGDVTLTYDENTLYVTPDSGENAITVINNLTSTSTTDALSAMQGKVLNDMMTTLAYEVVLVQNDVSGLDQNVSDNAEQIQFLQDDMRGKTNVTINNVHQDYVNFSSDPQTQLNNKADKDLSNVTYPQVVADGVVKTGAGDRVIKSYISSDGLTWYRIWASGWKECGGSIQASALSDYITTITLPLEFSNTNYTVHVTPLAQGSDTYSHYAGNKTTTTFRLRNRADAACQWSAMGY